MFSLSLRLDKAAQLVEHIPPIGTAFGIAPIPVVWHPQEGQAAHLLHMSMEAKVPFIFFTHPCVSVTTLSLYPHTVRSYTVSLPVLAIHYFHGEPKHDYNPDSKIQLNIANVC